MQYTMFDTAFGSFGYVAQGSRLVSAYLPQSAAGLRRSIRKHWPDATEAKRLLPGLRKQIVAYFRGTPAAFDVDLDLSGITPFRRAVLEQCLLIPYGRTVTYAELARAAGNPRAARAVGGAMAHNPIPLIIPCHRVLRSDGALGGFSSPGETKLKARMLRLEGALGGGAST